MNSLHLESVIVDGEKAALALATEMVNNSRYFSFEPLPDDQYEFQFRAENLSRVKAFLKALESSSCDD